MAQWTKERYSFLGSSTIRFVVLRLRAAVSSMFFSVQKRFLMLVLFETTLARTIDGPTTLQTIMKHGDNIIKTHKIRKNTITPHHHENPSSTTTRPWWCFLLLLHMGFLLPRNDPFSKSWMRKNSCLGLRQRKSAFCVTPNKRLRQWTHSSCAWPKKTT